MVGARVDPYACECGRGECLGCGEAGPTHHVLLDGLAVDLELIEEARGALGDYQYLGALVPHHELVLAAYIRQHVLNRSLALQ